MAKAIWFLLLAGALGASGCATSRFLIEAEDARTNTHIALAFEETVFNKHDVREGFSRYVASDYVEHDPDLPDGDSTLSVKRTVAQKDLVAVHAFWNRHADQNSGVARVDIYRLENARIVEHWSVRQPLAGARTDGKQQP